jgi:hypothetical protein
VVTTVNGAQVRDATFLRNQLGMMRVGDALSLEILRDGRRMPVSAKVGAREDVHHSEGALRNERLAGMTVGDLTPDHPAYGHLQGIVVQALSERRRACQSNGFASVNRPARASRLRKVGRKGAWFVRATCG